MDLACGRGGDILKWMDAGVKSAHGLDISTEEVKQARARFVAHKKRKRWSGNPYTFDATDQIGESAMDWAAGGKGSSPKKWASVTCQFSAHYAARSDQDLEGIFRNVRLKDAWHARTVGGRTADTRTNERTGRCLGAKSQKVDP